MSSGKIVQSGGKTIYVFGVAEVPSSVSGYVDKYHIGVNLDNSKVEDVKDNYPTEVYFHHLTDKQQSTLASYIPVFHTLKGSVLTVSAKARSGKDFLADRVIDYFHDVGLLPLSAPIKEVRNLLYGAPPQGVKDRAPLIMIGQGLRKEDPNIWIKVWLDRAIKKSMVQYTRKFICQDVRQPNEFSFFKSLGALTVKVEADEEKRLNKIREVDGEAELDEKLLNNETETQMSGFNAEISVFNDYTDDYPTAIRDTVFPALTERGW